MRDLIISYNEKFKLWECFRTACSSCMLNKDLVFGNADRKKFLQSLDEYLEKNKSFYEVREK